jgi:hypothetical protein
MHDLRERQLLPTLNAPGMNMHIVAMQSRMLSNIVRVLIMQHVT